MTRRTYLTMKVMLERDVDAGLFVGREAVSSVGIEHEEWDLDGEKKTWAEWEAGEAGEAGEGGS